MNCSVCRVGYIGELSEDEENFQNEKSGKKIPEFRNLTGRS